MSIVDFEVIFLGTAAGKPSRDRNVSSLALRMDGECWLFDVGEATQHRLIDARNRWVSPGKITKIFISHLHGDHIYGLPGLLSTMDLTGVGKSVIDIYGPKGLREYLAVVFRLTQTELGRPYRVHELLFAGERPSAPAEAEDAGGNSIVQSQEGVWDVIVDSDARVQVKAAPIVHRVNCIGYVFHEADGYGNLDMSVIKPMLDANTAALREQGVRNPMALLSKLKGPGAKAIELPDGQRIEPVRRDKPGRKVVVLGDTSNPYGPLELIAKDASLLIHEATNVYIGAEVDEALATKGETPDSCRERMISRGHSTPAMAGDFAKAIGARSLILNHLSPRLLPDAHHIIGVVRKEATESWDSGREAIVGRDFMVVKVPREDTGLPVTVVESGS